MSKAVRFTLTLALVLGLTATACAAGTITRISDGKNVTLPQLIAAAERSDLILVGEAHDSQAHHDMELSIIRSLLAKKLPFTIGLEMIESESQPALDDWVSGKLSTADFKTIYAKNWSLDWNLYRDIFLFARDNRIPMAGLNISKVLVAKVSRQGYAALNAEERKNLPQGTSCDLNNPHTVFLKNAFQEVFKHVTNGRIFTYFCEAQTLRNSGMALNTARYLGKHPGQKMVVLAGIWHAVKNAIPEQLERNGSKLTNTVILPVLPELDTDNATPDLVDYLVAL